jgi:hypothetical protein
MKTKHIDYHYRGLIERPVGKRTANHPICNYKWVEGWAENQANGLPGGNWATRVECQAEARAQGSVARFVR